MTWRFKIACIWDLMGPAPFHLGWHLSAQGGRRGEELRAIRWGFEVLKVGNAWKSASGPRVVKPF